MVLSLYLRGLEVPELKKSIWRCFKQLFVINFDECPQFDTITESNNFMLKCNNISA